MSATKRRKADMLTPAESSKAIARMSGPMKADNFMDSLLSGVDFTTLIPKITFANVGGCEKQLEVCVLFSIFGNLFCHIFV
jgi:hypothetical protein